MNNKPKDIGSKINVYLEIIVRDKHGLVRQYIRKKSAVRNLGRILYGLLLARGGYPLGEEGVKASCNVREPEYGSSVEVWTEWYSNIIYGGGTPMGCNADSGDDSYGIVVGSGSTPVSDDDYNLESKIPHGTGDGQLYYSEHSFSDVEVGGNYARFRVARNFSNLGSVDVTVYEFGLIVRNYWKHKNAITKDVMFLICRDVVSEGVVVKPNETLTVAYIFEVTL